jgi:thymidine phosphorylase
METSEVISHIAAGNANDAKEALMDLLSSRAFEALDSKKIEIAQNMFADNKEEEPDETETEEEE